MISDHVGNLLIGPLRGVLSLSCDQDVRNGEWLGEPVIASVKA